MRFQVQGANSESGDDIDMMLEAPTRSDVEQLAHNKGILVSTITPLVPPPPLPAHGKEEPEAISLVEDPPSTNGHTDEHPRGLITVNANSPSESAHTGAGHLPDQAHHEAAAEYHIIMNQSLYLLETAVNRHMRDGWEPQGGLSVGMSNNALQYFQSMVRRKHAATA